MRRAVKPVAKPASLRDLLNHGGPGVATNGGRAPVASERDVPGEMVEVPYAADYYFWMATS